MGRRRHRIHWNVLLLTTTHLDRCIYITMHIVRERFHSETDKKSFTATDLSLCDILTFSPIITGIIIIIMVLIEHLPLLGLALGLAHLHHGRVSHSHPPHLNQATVPLISDGSSQLHQAPPRLIAARASDESHETTIQVTQTHLQGILDRIKSLEEEISSMMASRANSFLDSSSTPAQHSALDPDDVEFSKATMAAMKTARLAATTRQDTKTTTPGGKPSLDLVPPPCFNH